MATMKMMRVILMAAVLAIPWATNAQEPAPAPATAAEATEQPAAAPEAAAAEPAKAEEAKPAPAKPEGIGTSPAANEDTEAEPTVGELLQGTAKVVDDWKTLGWIAGLIALINLLTHLLRFKWLNDLLEAKNLKHIKPWIAAGLGALTGGFTTFQTGAGVLNSVVAGLMAGFAAIGAHEVMSTKKRKAQRETLAAASETKAES
jgi:hypothetical protein